MWPDFGGAFAGACRGVCLAVSAGVILTLFPFHNGGNAIMLRSPRSGEGMFDYANVLDDLHPAMVPWATEVALMVHRYTCLHQEIGAIDLQQDQDFELLYIYTLKQT